MRYTRYYYYRYSDLIWSDFGSDRSVCYLLLLCFCPPTMCAICYHLALFIVCPSLFRVRPHTYIYVYIMCVYCVSLCAYTYLYLYIISIICYLSVYFACACLLCASIYLSFVCFFVRLGCGVYSALESVPCFYTTCICHVYTTGILYAVVVIKIYYVKKVLLHIHPQRPIHIRTYMQHTQCVYIYKYIVYSASACDIYIYHREGYTNAPPSCVSYFARYNISFLSIKHTTV